MREFTAISEHPVDRLTFTPDGRSLIAVGNDLPTIRDLTTGAVRQLGDVWGEAVGLAVSPDGRWLAVGTDCYGWSLHDLATGQRLYRFGDEDDHLPVEPQHEEFVSVAWLPDGRQLAVASDNLLQIVDIGTDGRPTTLESFREVAGWCAGVACEPSGAWVAMARTESEQQLFGVDFWNATRDAPLALEWPATPWDRFRLSLASDASAVAVWVKPLGAAPSTTPTLDVWDLRTRQCRFTTSDVPDDFGTVAFTAGGRLLAAGAADGTVTVWDGQTGAVRAVYDWGIPSPKAVAFAPDGLTLAAGGSDGRVVVWDVEG